MATSKNNTSPTKVVSLRLPIEEYEKYASEASDLELDLSPHLMEKLKEFEETQSMNKALENTFFDVSDERDKYHEEQVKLKAEIQSLKSTVSTLRNDNETTKSDNRRATETAKLTADSLLKIEREKLIKSQKEYALSLEKKDATLSSKEKEITDLKQEQIATMKKMEETLDVIIDKAHDFYYDAPVFSKKNLGTFDKPLKKSYFEAFPKPENKPKPLFTLSSGIANRVLEEFKKTHNL